MKNYKGLKNDKIIGGGKWVEKYNEGGEIFNFLPYKGYYYGYVQPMEDTIKLERFRASKKDNSINRVLVIWTAPSPNKGTVIIGWYKKATIFREWQAPPKNSNRRYKGEDFGYYIKAKVKNCKLLSLDERVFKIPRGKGWMGQSNVWYADHQKHIGFKQKVLDFIKKGVITQKNKPPRSKKGKPWQTDPNKRQKIEENAIKITTRHYENLGYIVDSVEKDNIGWDLEASLNDKLLKLEVKGLSQDAVTIELTPNEYNQVKKIIYKYNKLKKYEDNYKICIVTKALSKRPLPLLSLFSFSPNGKWEDERGNQLKIIEIISARMNT